MSLISEAARIEIEVLALHGEAALAGISRRGEKDDVTVGEIAATGERLDDAALAGERRVVCRETRGPDTIARKTVFLASRWEILTMRYRYAR